MTRLYRATPLPRLSPKKTRGDPETTPENEEMHLLPRIAKVLDTLVLYYYRKVRIHLVLKLQRRQVLVLVVLRNFPKKKRQTAKITGVAQAIAGSGKQQVDIGCIIVTCLRPYTLGH